MKELKEKEKLKKKKRENEGSEVPKTPEIFKNWVPD